MIWNLHDWGICWDEESQKARGRAVPSVPQLEVPCAARRLAAVHSPVSPNERARYCRLKWCLQGDSAPLPFPRPAPSLALGGAGRHSARLPRPRVLSNTQRGEAL